MNFRDALLCVILSVVISLSGCTNCTNVLEKQPIELSSTLIGTSDDLNEFLSLQADFKSSWDNDECYNITPQFIVENSDYRIFKYDISGASFLLYDNKIFPLGDWFGGYGLTDAKIADIDCDNVMELYFTFSWGSGIHRSQAGYFNPQVSEIKIFDYSHMNEDMMLVANGKGGLSLYQATISPINNFANLKAEANDYIADIILENDSDIALSFPTQ